MDTLLTSLSKEKFQDFETLLTRIWDHPDLLKEFNEIPIRLEARRVHYANLLLENNSHLNKNPIINATIGDIRYDGGIEAYDRFLDEIILERTTYKKPQYIEDLSCNNQYDITAQGEEKVRQKVLDYIQEYYGFDDVYKTQCIDTTMMIGGGMTALKYTIKGFLQKALNEQKTARFIQPYNCFGTWKSLIRSESLGREKKLESHDIEVLDENNLHLVADQVHTFYAEHTENNNEDIWYLSPVANPSGTEMDNTQLKSVCEAIYENNEHAIIVLDTVYTRIMGKERCNLLFKKLFEDDKLLKNIIFIESASKTHGIPGTRAGLLFTSKEDHFKTINKINILESAGHSKDIARIWYAIAHESQDRITGLQQLYQIWNTRRQGIYENIIQTSDIFASSQPHIENANLALPSSIYLCPKLDEGFAQIMQDSRDIVKNAGINGVPVKMYNSKVPTHLRLSVGAINTLPIAKES